MPASATELDEAELERLYVELEKPLYNVVYRWVWSPEEARDLVQEAFIRLWRMRERVEIESVKPLLFRIALNLASNRRRSRKLWRWVSLEAIWRRAAPAPDPEEATSSNERRAAVQHAVDALPDRYRRVVALCELAGMSYADAAGVLDIPPGTVASRKHTALKLLRRRLGQFAEEADEDR
jgi:RNA polymerase sigma-70 factor (ECF subfamily)